MADVIYRKEALETISNFGNRKYRREHGTLNDAYKLISCLPSAQQWIPCGERIPAAYDMVLCFQPKTSGGAIWIGYFDIGGFWVSDDGCEQRTNPVKAWMPLPEPPEPYDGKTDE